MTTPPQKKRHDATVKWGYDPESSGIFFGLSNPGIGFALGKFFASYEHLEGMMARVLAVLLGGYDHLTAGYVLRSIRNPSTKRSVLWDLLCKAPINAGMPETFDEILREYDLITAERNRLAHGKWFTHANGDVSVCKGSEHGLDFLESQQIVAADIEVFTHRSGALGLKILLVTETYVEARMRAQGLL